MVKQHMDDRPNYFHGQLLLEEDFLREQHYHVTARHLHNLQLHGTGVVWGLEVEKSGDKAVTVGTGLALDERGREVMLREAVALNLSHFGANDRLQITISYEEEKPDERANRWTTYAVVSATKQGDRTAGVTLAEIQFDRQGRLDRDAINPLVRRYATAVIAPGSITAGMLEERLRTGWVRLPFRPLPLVPDKDISAETLPPFLVGVTEARADQRAGGSMAIAAPLGATKATRLRIAGATNERGIKLVLMVGGWDKSNRRHERRSVLEQTIPPGERLPDGSYPYERTFPVTGADLDPEYSTLSLGLESLGKASISLIAVEFSF